MPTVIIAAGRPSSCRDQNKQEDVRRCLPSRKHLLLTFLTPDLSSSPTFLIKNHSRFGLLSFFLSPPSCFATSCTVALQPLQPSSFRYDAIDHVASPPHVHDRALSVTFTSGSPERFPLHYLYVVKQSPYVKRCHYRRKWRGCRPLSAPSRWADLRVLPLPAASITLMCDETVGVAN